MSGGRPRYAWSAEAALVFVSIAWGATFVLVKSALADVSTVLFLTLRFGAAALLLFAFFGRFGRRPGFRASVRPGLITGAFLFSGYVLQTAGLRHTTPAKAGFITGLYIPLVPLISALAFRRVPYLVEFLGIVCAFAGMALMTVDSNLSYVNRGDLLVGGCAIAYALHIVVLGHFAPRIDAAWLATMQIATGAVAGAALFWWVEPVRLVPSAALWTALAVTSVIATALAFAIQTWAQQYASPTRTALIFSLEPVFAWLTSFIMAGEVLTARATAGAILILAGVLLVELKPGRVSQHPPFERESA